MEGPGKGSLDAVTAATHRIAELIRSHRFDTTTEALFQDSIAKVLTKCGVKHEREVWVADGDRIDFLLDDGLGIEVKIGGSMSPLLRQLMRYATSPDVTGLVLVTSRLQLRSVPARLAGKPVAVATCWTPP